MITYYDYGLSKRIAMQDYPFYALLAALIRQADEDNLNRLKMVYPETVETFRQRYRNPGGLSDEELQRVTGPNQ